MHAALQLQGDLDARAAEQAQLQLRLQSLQAALAHSTALLLCRAQPTPGAHGVKQ